jgi:prevent-host-death family protein
MARHLNASEARDNFAKVVNRVSKNGERVVLLRRGKNVAALVPLDDFKRREEEDRLDLIEARKRLDDPSDKRISYKKVRRELGLE